MSAKRIVLPFPIDARMPRRGQVVDFVLAIKGKKRAVKLQDLQEVVTEFVTAATTPTVVETTIAHYDAPVAAFDALINAVVKSDTEVARVKNVDLE